MSERPVHGGRLQAAARAHNIPVEDWLDLSTGINPEGWPVPPVPAEVWRRLPEDNDGLVDIIRTQFGAPDYAGCVPVPGTQAAIEALPFLRPPCRVGIPEPGYSEHGHWWRQAGHEVVPLALELARSDPEWASSLDVLVWVQPNNPTGLALSPDQLLEWYDRLAGRGGWLVVDEAFADGLDELSLARATGSENPGLVVLRSLGKFFGLAGLRAGAVLTDATIAAQLQKTIGPWALSGPARYLMALALEDNAWQSRATVTLIEESSRLAALLDQFGLAPSGGTLLYQYVPHPDAGRIAEAFARNGILIRSFQQPPALRFGLPGDETQWQRLRNILSRINCN
ncbi:MAG: threonine-phosphate decarboxylase CobD [Marinobacter sp.]|uniref:threonine-phosphate decarboxylase CobD n=1 Tax=Marinobacter sp. TaxID=50741 RepID=UPI0034A08CDF